MDMVYTAEVHNNTDAVVVILVIMDMVYTSIIIDTVVVLL